MTTGHTFKPLDRPFKMVFDYRRFFMGTKFALSCHATKQTGGWADFDNFVFKEIK